MAHEPNEYPIDIQCLIHLLLTLLHNFLHIWEPSRFLDELDPKQWRQPADMISSNEDIADDVPLPAGTQLSCHDVLCDKIATEMWTQYQQTLEHCCQNRHR